ncbi:MAG: hypothetical protein CV088_13460 [Nitrospira sp. LK70]|nr:hypothetical protein [Nitrospira sp. LK70]
MPSLVYVVRSPLQSLHHALLPGDGSTVVLSLEDPLLPGKVLRAAPDTRLTEGERLSYEQVLAIVLESKVVTL